MHRQYSAVTTTIIIIVISLVVFVEKTYQQQKQEIYEPVKYVCHEKCVCRNESDSLVLDCTKQNLTHIINEWPPHSEQLTVSFSWNNFSNLQQVPRSEAKTISISFSHCKIQTFKSALFIDATGIKYLDLSWNDITGEELRPGIFRGRFNTIQYEPISMEQLDLSHNNIQSLNSKLFEHTPNLTRLDISYNPLKLIDIQTSTAVSSVLKLTWLNLANTSIETIPDTMVSRLSKLRELDLSCNLIKIVPESVSYLTQLEILKLGENPIEYLNDQSFIGLHHLIYLNVSGMTRLQMIRHNTFSSLYRLQVLNCSNNPLLFHINQEAFGINNAIPPLKELYLSNNNLNTLHQDQLGWSNLSVLELSGNRWLCDCELYHMLLQLNKTHNDIISPVATCSLPVKFAGTELDNITAIEEACDHLLFNLTPSKIPTGAYGILLKFTLSIAIVLLIFLASFIFWKVLRKYKNIRSVNTMYPVMYMSAPNTEY